MTVLVYPADSPEEVRGVARSWRAARETLGSAGAELGLGAGALDAVWEGIAAGAAVGQLQRTVTGFGAAAAALDEAAGVLDAYAVAVESTRADIDGLRAEAASVAAWAGSRRAADPLGEAQIMEALADTNASIRRRYETAMADLEATAGRLGQRLGEVAARARPGYVNPTAGPGVVVRQNADDTGEVDWVTDLALNHPNLTVEQRLWILEHRNRFTEQLEFLLSAASNPAVTDDVAGNYAETVDRRNTRAHLSDAFDTNHLEFVDALLLPMVITALGSFAFRESQNDALLVAAVMDAALPGTPPPQYASPPVSPRSPVPLGFLGRRDYTAFTREVHAGLQRAGYDDAIVFFRGSSVTGVRYRDGSPFDSGLQESDLDLAIVSPTAFARAQELGIPLRGGGARTPPLDRRDLVQLGLAEEVSALRSLAARRVSMMIYRSSDDVMARGPNITVPRP